MSTTKYTLIPRGPVRGIGENVTITDKCEIELNDFQAVKVLLQGHSLLKGSKMDEVVKIGDFVEGVDPQAIKENVNLVEDYTAGCKRANVSYSKVFGLPRDFVPGSSKVDAAGKVDGENAPAATPESLSESTSTSTSESAKSESTQTAKSETPVNTKAKSTSESASESASTASATSETAKK